MKKYPLIRPVVMILIGITSTFVLMQCYFLPAIGISWKVVIASFETFVQVGFFFLCLLFYIVFILCLLLWLKNKINLIFSK
jgi:hypothetical protein